MNVLCQHLLAAALDLRKAHQAAIEAQDEKAARSILLMINRCEAMAQDAVMATAGES